MTHRAAKRASAGVGRGTLRPSAVSSFSNSSLSSGRCLRWLYRAQASSARSAARGRSRSGRAQNGGTRGLLPSTRSDRQPAKAEPRFLEYDHTSFQQRFLEVRKIRQQQSELSLGTPLGHSPQEDHRGLTLLSKSEEGAEVGVRRNDNPLLLLRALEDRYVVAGLKTGVAYMRCFVTGIPQALGDERRERVVDEESQEAGRSGSSRSRTASAA